MPLLLDHLGHLTTAERGAPGEHRIHHQPQGVKIGAMVDPLTGRLFRSHVFGRSNDVAVGGVGRTAEQLGDAEVGELHPVADRHAVGEEDVGGLEVAVHDPVVVR